MNGSKRKGKCKLLGAQPVSYQADGGTLTVLLSTNGREQTEIEGSEFSILQIWSCWHWTGQQVIAVNMEIEGESLSMKMAPCAGVWWRLYQRRRRPSTLWTVMALKPFNIVSKENNMADLTSNTCGIVTQSILVGIRSPTTLVDRLCVLSAGWGGMWKTLDIIQNVSLVLGVSQERHAVLDSTTLN